MKNALFLAGLFFVFKNTLAQVSFYAKIPEKAVVGRQFQVSFVLENADGSNFKPPNFKGFRVLSGPNQSSSYQWINGRSSKTFVFYYILSPIEEGTFEIGSASIESNKETLYTKSKKIEVSKATQNSQQNNSQNRQQNRQNPFPEPQTPPKDADDWKKQAKEGLFAKVYVDNTSPYVGEQIFMYVKLYQRVQTNGTRVSEMPQFEGFWRQEVDVNVDDWQIENYNGRQYNTLVIAKYALFPQHAGNLKIKALKFNSEVMIPKAVEKRIFGFRVQSYEYEPVEYSFSSNTFSIKAKPLPEKGKPDYFSGAVGSFSVSSSIDSSTIKAGNAINYKIEIKGTGNIMSISDPRISCPSSFEVYDPEKKEYISERSNYVNGSKTYQYVIVPNKLGTYTISIEPFSYFDIKSKQYKIIEYKNTEVQVLDNPKFSNANSTRLSYKDYEDKDIHHIALKDDLKKQERTFYGSSSFFILLFSPIVLLSIALFWLKRKESIDTSSAEYKRKKALDLAQKRLEKADIALKNNEKEAFYHEIFDALYGYVGDKLNIDQANLNKSLVVEKFKENALNEALINKFIEVLQHTEEALYSPASKSKMKEDYETAKTWIVDVEKEMV